MRSTPPGRALVHQAFAAQKQLVDHDAVVPQFQLARFDFRDIENVVDDLQQVPAALVDVLGVFGTARCPAARPTARTSLRRNR